MAKSQPDDRRRSRILAHCQGRDAAMMSRAKLVPARSRATLRGSPAPTAEPLAKLRLRAGQRRIVGLMAFKPRAVVAALLAGGATVAALIGAPTAAADGADATIADLQAQGHL